MRTCSNLPGMGSCLQATGIGIGKGAKKLKTGTKSLFNRTVACFKGQTSTQTQTRPQDNRTRSNCFRNLLTDTVAPESADPTGARGSQRLDERSVRATYRLNDSEGYKLESPGRLFLLDDAKSELQPAAGDIGTAGNSSEDTFQTDVTTHAQNSSEQPPIDSGSPGQGTNDLGQAPKILFLFSFRGQAFWEDLRIGGLSTEDIREKPTDIKEYLELGVDPLNVGYCLKYKIPFEKVKKIEYAALPDLVQKDADYWNDFAQNATKLPGSVASMYDIKKGTNQSTYSSKNKWPKWLIRKDSSKKEWLKWVAHTVNEATELRKNNGNGSASLDQVDQFISASRAEIARKQKTCHSQLFGEPRFLMDPRLVGYYRTPFKNKAYYLHAKKQYEKYLNGNNTAAGYVEAKLFGLKQKLTQFFFDLSSSDNPGVWLHFRGSPHLIKLHCRTLFQEAMMKNIGQERLIEVLSELVYFRAHLMEWKRGSASITEQLLHYIVQFHGGSIKLGKMIDCIALTKPTAKEFENEFRDMVKNQTLISPQETTDTEKLCCACRSGKLEDVKKLLQSSQLSAVTIDSIKDAAGYSLLHLAALSGKPDLVEFLLSEAHADPNLATDSGETPVLLAATRGNGEALSILLDHGATVDPIPTLGVTPLHIAAGTIEDTAVIKKMIEKGAALLIQDCDGKLAAHYAKGAGNNNVYKLLLEHVELPEGADLPSNDECPDTRAEDGMMLGPVRIA